MKDQDKGGDPEFKVSFKDAPQAPFQPSEDADAELQRQFKRDDMRTRHWVRKWAVKAVCIICAVLVVVYLLNIILPRPWRWLGDSDLSEIKSTAIAILSALISSLATGFFLRK